MRLSVNVKVEWIMARLRKNNRVRDRDKFLGRGTVLKKAKGLPGYYMIQWDKNPPQGYNLGKNPCIASEENLKLLKNQGK